MRKCLNEHNGLAQKKALIPSKTGSVPFLFVSNMYL